MSTRALAAVLLLLAGCYKTPTPKCEFLCGADQGCPDGYRCSTDDHRCHLVEASGALAACDDTLVPDAHAVVDGWQQDASGIDATPYDAPAYDAAAYDAGPADANQPPLLGAIATPQGFVAGDSIAITAVATDPETPPEPLTFTAPWPSTNRDPYADFGGGDTAGGAFSATTHTFTMPAGLLGDFDVDFTVCDTLPTCDHQVVTVHVAASPVELDEVIFASGVAEDVELINRSGAAVPLSGWTLAAATTSYTFGTVSIPANGYLLVHWNQSGTDTASELYTCNHAGGCALASLALVEEVALSGAATGRSRDLRDFVKWGAGTSSVVARAVTAGQWPSASSADYADGTGLIAGTSLARTIGANTETAADWFVDTSPTPGAANTP